MGRGKKIDDVAVVVNAAIKLIEEGGIEEFSTRRLAAALRISAMTLYNYFSDREAILKEVAIRCLGDFTRDTEADIAASRDGGTAANPLQALKLLARRLYELGMTRPKLYLFLFDSSMGGVREDPEVSQQYGYFGAAAAEALKDRGLSPELRKDILLFELLANSLVVGCVRWPSSIDKDACLALVDRAYDRILARYESLVS